MTHHVMKMRLSQFGSARCVRLRRQDLRSLQRPPKVSYLFFLVSPQDDFASSLQCIAFWVEVVLGKS